MTFNVKMFLTLIACIEQNSPMQLPQLDFIIAHNIYCQTFCHTQYIRILFSISFLQKIHFGVFKILYSIFVELKKRVGIYAISSTAHYAWNIILILLRKKTLQILLTRIYRKLWMTMKDVMHFIPARPSFSCVDYRLYTVQYNLIYRIQFVQGSYM